MAPREYPVPSYSMMTNAELARIFPPSAPIRELPFERSQNIEDKRGESQGAVALQYLIDGLMSSPKRAWEGLKNPFAMEPVSEAERIGENDPLAIALGIRGIGSGRR